MRGKGAYNGTGIVGIRITPAYAGKSSMKTRLTLERRDHPRLCGEKLDFIFEYGFQLGSPPPMRGKAHIWVHLRLDGRITPAYAGKSIQQVPLNLRL